MANQEHNYDHGHDSHRFLLCRSGWDVSLEHVICGDQDEDWYKHHDEAGPDQAVILDIDWILPEGSKPKDPLLLHHLDHLKDSCVFCRIRDFDRYSLILKRKNQFVLFILLTLDLHLVKVDSLTETTQLHPTQLLVIKVHWISKYLENVFNACFRLKLLRRNCFY